MYHFGFFSIIAWIEWHSIFSPLPICRPLSVEFKFFRQSRKTFHLFTINLNTDFCLFTMVILSRDNTTCTDTHRTSCKLVSMRDNFITFDMQLTLHSIVNLIFFQPCTVITQIRINRELIIHVTWIIRGCLLEFWQIISKCSIIPLSYRNWFTWVTFGLPHFFDIQAAIGIDIIDTQLEPKLIFFPHFTQTCFNMRFKCSTSRIFRFPTRFFERNTQYRLTERRPSSRVCSF